MRRKKHYEATLEMKNEEGRSFVWQKMIHKQQTLWIKTQKRQTKLNKHNQHKKTKISTKKQQKTEKRLKNKENRPPQWTKPETVRVRLGQP